ncbi:cation acetate symporter [Euzebya tangerina]|uniref:sodium/solute symporter n=1 Tax=Euzebya tangerina TaxID=591198 RepID=UPI000E322E86|nr:cation acetate symporter [Euzebya tangerina]
MTALVATIVVVSSTLLVGVWGVRHARTTSTFLVANRSVHPVMNAFAVCGEYLSAGSYLGLAGLVVIFGVDILWLPVGWTAGYVFLLLFVAAPLRRFGAYTIPEFAEGRLGSRRLRVVSACFVLVISVMYLLPQMKGAGVVLQQLVGAPYWVGVFLIGTVVAIGLSTGGMRSITFIQAFQFVLIAVGVVVPLALLGWGSDEALVPTATDQPPAFDQATQVTYPRDVVLSLDQPTTVIVVDASGTGEALEIGPGRFEVTGGTELRWSAGTPVPHVSDLEPTAEDEWAVPFLGSDLAGGHPLYFAFSALVASALGTMGLPHVLVRFYTNPDGNTARRTTVWVLALLGPYYSLIPLYSLFARQATPEVLSTGDTEVVSLVVTDTLLSGGFGEAATAVIAAGAVAAMLSTSAGLLISVAGALSHDFTTGGVPQFRRAAWAGAAVAMLLGLIAQPFDISIMVSWAFAVAASSFCPLLILGIWWSGLTERGALAAMLVGGSSATLAILWAMVSGPQSGWAEALTSAPAAWSVPLAVGVAVIVSRLDPMKVDDVHQTMAVMHLPDHRLAVEG